MEAIVGISLMRGVRGAACRLCQHGIGVSEWSLIKIGILEHQIQSIRAPLQMRQSFSLKAEGRRQKAEMEALSRRCQCLPAFKLCCVFKSVAVLPKWKH